MKTNAIIRDVRPYSMKELCGIYRISDKTMRKWLLPFREEIGPRMGHIYNVAQVITIFEKLGVPGELDV